MHIYGNQSAVCVMDVCSSGRALVDIDTRASVSAE